MTLPPGWEEAQLRNVCLLVKQVRPDEEPDREFMYIDISSIDRAAKTIVSPQRLPGREAPTRARQRVCAGDILFSTVRPNLRTIARVPESLDGEVASTGFCVLRPSLKLNANYVFWALLAEDFQSRVIAKARGISYPAVRDPDVFEETIPIPPRAEQDRIVAGIEAAMAGVDGALAAIGETEQLLDVHRAAVLEAECLGRVGGEDHPPAANGLPGIPQGWEWRPVAELAADEDRAITDGPFGSNLKTAHYTDSGPRVIRLQNIGEDQFIDAEAHISREHFERLRAHEARAGDVVVASLGETLPRACVVPENLGPAIVKADCPRIRVGSAVRSGFLSAAMNSPPVRRQAAGLIAGIGRPRLNLAKLKQLMIPTPPLDEQDRILHRIRAHAEARDRVAEALVRSLEEAEALRRSLLSRAFAGRLVSHDPADEPASELLRRIRDETGGAEAPLKLTAS